ncbi:glycoside hydrolase family 19 protein, partial [Plesiomonas sp.]|uniref:glycoside hydrolase family 19 protein n=1 Tax=Plesiomonas sp. TaxID=2486279 RepID=UPI003F3B24B3
LELELKEKPNLYQYALTVNQNMNWIEDSAIQGILGDSKPWFIHPAGMMGLVVDPSNKQITLKMLRNIWLDTDLVSDERLQTVASELNRNIEKMNINTSNRLYHFMAQVYQEVGPSFKVVENLNYKPNVLISKFDYYGTRADEAEQDGRTREHAANQVTIANKAYGNRCGNGSVSSGDGYRYRGRGAKQLTFRSNYQDFTRFSRVEWGTTDDYESNPDLLMNIDISIRSALFFWRQKNLYSIADRGVTYAESSAITEIVNKYDSSYQKRFENLTSLISRGIFDDAL